VHDKKFRHGYVISLDTYHWVSISWYHSLETPLMNKPQSISKSKGYHVAQAQGFTTVFQNKMCTGGIV